jgi:hypothetical protein
MRSIILIITFIFYAQGEWPASLERKIDKVIKKSIGVEHVIRKHIPIALNHSRPAPGLVLYSLYDSEKIAGYLLLTTAKGRYEYFDYCVVYSPELEVIMVSVLTYRSDHGYEICNKSWLKQFSGSRGCDLTYGKEIDAISGATLSATSLTEDIQFLCELMNSPEVQKLIQ